MAQVIQAKPPALHEKQVEVLKALKHNRFNVCVAGRRWGKTSLSIVASFEKAMAGEKVWVIFPVYPQAMDSFRVMKSLARQFPDEYITIREVEKRIEFSNGGSIQIKSADKPERLRGAGGLSLIVFDEAAYQSKETWETVRPILSDSLGQALFISTPNGMNWFYELYENAKLKDDWKVHHYPTESNPNIMPEELFQAREELGSLVYAQEFNAEFTEVGHMFKREWFKYYDTIAGDDPEYILGDEIVKHSELSIFGTMDTALSIKETADYSVIMTVGTAPSGKLLVMDVFRARLEAPELLPQIEAKINEYNMSWLGVEDSSFGLGIIQMARRQGLPIRNLKADKSKTARAVPAAAGVENGSIWFLKNAKWLVEFERELTSFPSSGSHDDMVDALAYAARFGIVRKTNWSVT